MTTTGKEGKSSRRTSWSCFFSWKNRRVPLGWRMPKHLTESETAAFAAWLNTTTYRKAGELLNVSNTALCRWRQGSGMHPAQYDALIQQLKPFLNGEAAATTPLPPSLKPTLIPLYRKLCELNEHAPHLLVAVEALVEQLNQTAKNSAAPPSPPR